MATATTWKLSTEWHVMQTVDRELTLNVYRQLDEVPYDAIEVAGRVCPYPEIGKQVQVIGRDKATGALVRSWAWTRAMTRGPEFPVSMNGPPPAGWPGDLDMAELAAVAARPDTAAQLTHPARAHGELSRRRAQREWMEENGQDWEALPLIILG